MRSSRPSVQSYYNAFAATYENQRVLGSRYHAFVDDQEFTLASPWALKSDLLEVGCGTGLLLQRFARIARRACGVDVSENMLAKARDKGLNVQLADARALPFPEASFDVVVSFKTLAHVENLPLALHEIARVLRPRGVAVFETYNPTSLRTLVKTWLPRPTSKEFLESDVFCRYDSEQAVLRALGGNLRVVTRRGIRVLLPSSHALDWPLLGRPIERFERWLGDQGLGVRFGGFVGWVVQKIA